MIGSAHPRAFFIADHGPAVVVHDLDDAVAVLRAAASPELVACRIAPILLSPPGWAAVLGAMGWLRLIREARAAVPDAGGLDMLDCGDCSGYALEALRLGQRHLALAADAPGAPVVAARALALGAVCFEEPPRALTPFAARCASPPHEIMLIAALRNWAGCGDRMRHLG